MVRFRIYTPVTALVALLLCPQAFGQSWSSAYETGVANAKKGNWNDARLAFLQAIAFRPEDTMQPTLLPGSVKGQKFWHDGSLYSPNFQAALCGYKLLVGSTSGEDNSVRYKKIASEFLTLIGKGQTSEPTLYYLNDILHDSSRFRDVLEFRICRKIT